MDDAYITYRYARNVVHLHGPVYNPGEHVEGSSTFLFVILLAFFMLIGVPPTVAAPGLGILAFAGLSLVSNAIVQLVVRDRSRHLLGILAAVLVTASTPLAYYAASGMETTVYCFLVLLGLYLYLRSAILERSARAWPVVFALAALTRPEGAWFFGLVFGIDFLRRWTESAKRRTFLQDTLRTLGWFAIIFGPFLLFRRAYYGEWVPNSVIAKSGAMDPIKRMKLAVAVKALWSGPGIGMAKDYLEKMGIAAFVAPLGLLRLRTRYPVVLLLAFCGACVTVAVWNEGDWFPYFRLLTPAFAPLAVLVALGLRAILFQIEQQRLRWLVATALSLFLVGYTTDRLYFERNYRFPHTQVTDYMKWLGGKMNAVARDDDVLATDMAGIIPYYAGVRVIDTFGLCDAHIAHHGERRSRMGKTEWTYVFARKPTYYQFNFPGRVKLTYQDPAFKDQVNDYWALITPGYLNIRSPDRKLLLVRKDRPELERLVEATGGTLKDPRDELRRLGMWP